jgi:alkaline phosphatase D
MWFDRDVARFDLDRRQLLKTAAGLGLLALTPLGLSTPVWSKPVFARYPFSLGVASGDPSAGGAVIWTRLAPEPLEGGAMPMKAVEVGWEVAADERMRQVVKKGSAIAAPELGHSVHVELDGLEPGREYWYRFIAGDEASQVGRLKTAPSVGAPVDRINFALCGCQHYETGYFTAYQHLAGERPDFVFHSGDYIYESRADGAARAGRVRQHNGDEIYTLVDYRNRYALYKSDPDLMAAHIAAPFIVTWDDHEVDNNWTGERDQDGTDPALFLLRRAAAFQAWYENMPVRRTQMPRGPDLRLYRSLSFGNLIDFHALDTRQYRSDQACGDRTLVGCEEAKDPARTVLGSGQERWLDEQLARSRATWTVLGQQVPIYMIDLDGRTKDRRLIMDKWDGYQSARDRLNISLKGHGLRNAVALSGDMHHHCAAELKESYDDPASATLGVEFTNTSISSNGDGSEVAEAWEGMKADNPHIKYHSARRGYVSFEVTSTRWNARFMVLDKVTEPGHPARVGGNFVVEAGKPALQTA